MVVVYGLMYLLSRVHQVVVYGQSPTKYPNDATAGPSGYEYDKRIYGKMYATQFSGVIDDYSTKNAIHFWTHGCTVEDFEAFSSTIACVSDFTGTFFGEVDELEVSAAVIQLSSIRILVSMPALERIDQALTYWSIFPIPITITTQNRPRLLKSAEPLLKLNGIGWGAALGWSTTAIACGYVAWTWYANYRDLRQAFNLRLEVTAEGTDAKRVLHVERCPLEGRGVRIMRLPFIDGECALRHAILCGATHYEADEWNTVLSFPRSDLPLIALVPTLTGLQIIRAGAAPKPSDKIIAGIAQTSKGGHAFLCYMGNDDVEYERLCLAMTNRIKAMIPRERWEEMVMDPDLTLADGDLAYKLVEGPKSHYKPCEPLECDGVVPGPAFAVAMGERIDHMTGPSKIAANMLNASGIPVPVATVEKWVTVLADMQENGTLPVNIHKVADFILARRSIALQKVLKRSIFCVALPGLTLIAWSLGNIGWSRAARRLVALFGRLKSVTGFSDPEPSRTSRFFARVSSGMLRLSDKLESAAGRISRSPLLGSIEGAAPAPADIIAPGAAGDANQPQEMTGERGSSPMTTVGVAKQISDILESTGVTGPLAEFLKSMITMERRQAIITLSSLLNALKGQPKYASSLLESNPRLKSMFYVPVYGQTSGMLSTEVANSITSSPSVVGDEQASRAIVSSASTEATLLELYLKGSDGSEKCSADLRAHAANVYHTTKFLPRPRDGTKYHWAMGHWLLVDSQNSQIVISSISAPWEPWCVQQEQSPAKKDVAQSAVKRSRSTDDQRGKKNAQEKRAASTGQSSTKKPQRGGKPLTGMPESIISQGVLIPGQMVARYERMLKLVSMTPTTNPEDVMPEAWTWACECFKLCANVKTVEDARSVYSSAEFRKCLKRYNGSVGGRIPLKPMPPAIQAKLDSEDDSLVKCGEKSNEEEQKTINHSSNESNCQSGKSSNKPDVSTPLIQRETSRSPSPLAISRTNSIDISELPKDEPQKKSPGNSTLPVECSPTASQPTSPPSTIQLSPESGAPCVDRLHELLVWTMKTLNSDGEKELISDSSLKGMCILVSAAQAYLQYLQSLRSALSQGSSAPSSIVAMTTLLSPAGQQTPTVSPPACDSSDSTPELRMQPMCQKDVASSKGDSIVVPPVTIDGNTTPSELSSDSMLDELIQANRDSLDGYLQKPQLGFTNTATHQLHSNCASSWLRSMGCPAPSFLMPYSEKKTPSGHVELKAGDDVKMKTIRSGEELSKDGAAKEKQSMMPIENLPPEHMESPLPSNDEQKSALESELILGGVSSRRRWRRDTTTSFVVVSFAFSLGAVYRPTQWTMATGSKKNNAKRRGPKGSSRSRRGTTVAQRYAHNVHSLRSVRGAVSSMPETSSSFMKTALDPAHARTYDMAGIPDANSVATNVYKSVITDVVTSEAGGSGYKWDSSTKKWNISGKISFSAVDYNGIWVPADAYLGAFWVRMGSTVDNYAAIAITQIADSGIAKYTGNHECRLAAKSVTIDQIGPYAQRGGYYTCCVPTDAIEYVNGQHIPFIDPIAARENQVDAYNGSTGVYGVMRPNNKSAMLRWADAVRTSVGFHMPGVESPCYVTYNQEGHGADQGWKGFWIGLMSPPSGTAWAMRVMVCTSVEVKTNEALGGSIPFFDDAALNMLLAIATADAGFYPASYNDLKRVISAVKSKYKKYKPLIDTAAGYIPYGGTVASVLNTLLGN